MILTITRFKNEFYIVSNIKSDNNHIIGMPLGNNLSDEKINEYITLIKKHMKGELKLFTSIYKEKSFDNYWCLFNIENNRWELSLDSNCAGQSSMNCSSEQLLDTFEKELKNRVKSI
jgi:DNA polymerase II small subunit/DNA polymerase delta subunit B